MSEKNYFGVLNSISVKDKVEKKNGLSYLSWAFAWGEFKKLHPFANYKVYEKEDGRIYWDDGKTAWVKVGVWADHNYNINGIEHIEYLPIMEMRQAISKDGTPKLNSYGKSYKEMQSIPLDEVTSFNANTAIQRALTKAIARHGLGLYIYAGEDLPESDKEEAKTKYATIKQVEEVYAICAEHNLSMDTLMTKNNIQNEMEFPLSVYTKTKAWAEKQKAGGV